MKRRTVLGVSLVLCSSVLMVGLACGKYGRPQRVSPSAALIATPTATPTATPSATPIATNDAGEVGEEPDREEASKRPKP